MTLFSATKELDFCFDVLQATGEIIDLPRKALASDMRELEVQQARRQGIQAPLTRVAFSSDPSPAKIHKSANDIPEFQIARQNVRFADAALAERRLARKAGDV